MVRPRRFFSYPNAPVASNGCVSNLKSNEGACELIAEAIELCRQAGRGQFISHRSGETEEVFMADFAVAMGSGQIKSGSPAAAP